MRHGDKTEVIATLSLGFLSDRAVRIAMQDEGWSGAGSEALRQFASLLRAPKSRPTPGSMTSLLLSSPSLVRAAQHVDHETAGSAKALCEAVATTLEEMANGNVPGQAELTLARVVLAELSRLTYEETARGLESDLSLVV